MPDTPTLPRHSTAKRGGPLELAILCYLGLGMSFMAVDFAAIDGGHLEYLAGSAPWYIRFLPLLTAGVLLLVWLATRRRLGTWSVGVGFLAQCLLVTRVIGPGVQCHLDSIPSTRSLSPSELEQAETAIDARILPSSSSRTGQGLMILRDPI